MQNVLYFKLSDDELFIEAALSYPWVDPRIWNEARRRGLESRLNAYLIADGKKGGAK